MKLEHLTVFSVAAKYQNLTRAAEVLHISQPAVSKGLKALERHLKAILYKRNGHGIKLTDQGWKLLPMANAILVNRDNVEKNFTSVRAPQPSGLFAIGGSYGPAAYFLPSLMSEFKKKSPGLQSAIRTGNRSYIERLLLKGEIEVALITLPARSPALVAEPYRPERMAAFVAPSHPLAKKKRIDLVELLRHPFVIRGDSNSDSNIKEILRGLEERGHKPQIAACYESPDAVKAAVSKKMGVGFLYKDLVKPETCRGYLKILKVDGLKLTAQSFIAYHKERPLSPDAEEFLRRLRRSRHKR